MQQNRSVHSVTQRHGGVDVIVVAVGEHDRPHAAAVDCFDDRSVIVGGIEHDHFTVVADQPDVVGDLPLAAVEGEDAVGRHQFDRHSTTTLRSTSPRSIL